MNVNNKPLDSSSQQEEAGFDLKKAVGMIMSHIPLFFIFITVSVLLAMLYVKHASPKYKISSMMLVEDQSNSPSNQMGLNSLTNVSSLFGMTNNAQNEVEILKSRSLMSGVVKALKLNVTVFRKDVLKKTELFDEAPFAIEVLYKTDSVITEEYDVDVKSNKIFIKGDDVNVTANFGSLIKLSQYDLIFKPTNKLIEPGGYTVIITSEDSKTESLSKTYKADLSDKTATTINLSFEYGNPRKGEAILSKLMQDYLQENLNDKVKIADSTLKFIDNRLSLVGAELSGVEKKFEQYKSENQLADIDEQSKALIGSTTDYQKQLNELEIQVSVLNDLQKYLSDPNNKRIVPGNVSAISDQSFAGGVQMYNELLLQRDKQALVYTEDNPVVKNLDNQISNMRATLLKNLQVQSNSLSIARNNLRKKMNSYSGLLSGVPKKARIYLDYSRQQAVKQQLYLFLLQKREETAISKTSTLSNARIVDNAKSEYMPSKIKIYIFGLFIVALGFLIPFSYLYAKDMFNLRILSKEDILAITDIPIVGEIGHSSSVENVVIVDNSRSIISEQFRAVRTNLQYLLSNDRSNVIMITSSMSGEGKSFITLNTGIALSLANKRVVFIELDLRKPKLTTNLGLQSSNGFSNYIISDKLTVDDILQPMHVNKNCYLISSGPIPPNPAEILLNERTGKLISELKQRFDYIFIDSAPVGLVSDALLLEQFVDINLYIVRQNYTLKEQLNIPSELKSTGRMKKVYLIVNDILRSKSGYGYGYGYGYSYGYGYGYGSDIDVQENKSWFRKLFNGK